MAEQRDRAKADAREKKLGGTDLTVYSSMRAQGVTKFSGYEQLDAEGKVIGLLKDGMPVKKLSQGDLAEILLDETSFYAESGGQDSDAGFITADGLSLEVLDVQKPVKGLISHKVFVRSGEVALGSRVQTQVDSNWRLGACQAHSATHIVHAALRQVLGPTALQSGSYNKPGYLRLDYAWTKALSNETKSEIEEVTNLAIRQDLAVSAQFMSVAEAKKWGAVALFGETYDESVRVIQVGGEWSRELCGGTHVARSSQVGLVSLMGDSSVGSGSRRIEALVGIEAFRALALDRALVSRVAEAMKGPRDQIEDRLSATIEDLKVAQRKLAALESAQLAERIPQLIADAEMVSNQRFVVSELGSVSSVDDIRGFVNQLRDKLANEAAVVVAFGIVSDKPMVVIAVTKPAQLNGAKAGQLVRVASAALGGGGGGKDDIAQGGGTDSNQVPMAIAAIRSDLAG
jgi:alanyl-tRNA synthetase